MKEKKGWSVERIAKTAVLTAGILVVIAIIASLIFPNPIGANVRLITRLIFAGTVVTAVFILAMWIYRARKNKRMLKIFSALLCIVLALVIVINLAVMNFYVMINQFLHRNTADPETVVNETQVAREVLLCIVLALVIVINLAVMNFYVMINQFLHRNTADPETVVNETQVAREVTEQIEEEGLVLLRNENKALPMTETKANVFGFASDAIIYGGSGSGAADESKNVNLSTALENVGIEVNEELAEFYKTKNDEAKAKNGVTIALSDYSVKEPSVEDYENGLLENAKEFSDTAIVVFGRAGGEGADMPMDMGAYEGGTEGRHYMELTENEEAMFDMVKENLFDMVKENFEKVIVLINSSSPMELGFLENEKVDAAMWIGGPGSVGLQGVANALCGEVNPSGRLVDTYAYDATSSPAYMNIGDFTYTGTEHENGGMLGGVAPYKFMNYQEGIYVGYRYYETAAQDGYINYEETVQYPFGYGLSYTTFEQKMGALSTEGDAVSVDVTVTNTGNVPGKEVVQLYYTPPYTKGGIEKSHVVLAAFDKTEELKPGESQTLTLSFQKEDMASYDYKEAKAYVLEKGDYAIKLMKNSHDVIDQRTYKVNETVVNRESDLVEATNQFDDVAGDIAYVSRADWAGTMPKEKAKDQVPSEEVLKALQNTEVETDPDAEDIVFKKHGLTLKDVKGLEYDDPKWEQLLEQLSIQDMEQLIGMSGWQSVRIGSVGKPEVLDVDGPAGLNGLINGTKGNQYTSAVVVGSTWNTKLPEEFGKALGDEAYANKVSGIYGPAMNIHRTPFSGRNFEYYSEDGLLSGKMGAAMVRGIKLMKNSHDVIDQRTYKVNETVVNRESDLVEATNQFDDVAGDIAYVSRADWAGTMPKEKAKDQVPSEEVLKALQNTEVETDPDAEDIVFKKHGLTLKDVKGLEYDDPKWEQLLEQLSIQDMEQLIGMSGWQSVRIGSVGKPEVLDVDGPAGLNGLINGTKGNQYTSAVVVGSTWNTKLPEEFGKALGDEAYVNKVSGIYGPAMNIHRTPFSGRNFEYYSEDGLLSGKMGAAMVRGCNEKNVYTYIKHFALNDQETNAIGGANWCNEQAMRELYLKPFELSVKEGEKNVYTYIKHFALNDQETNAIGGANWCNEQAMRELYLKPFELSVKEGKSKAIMTTWSRVGATWAGASKPLLQNVLRDEWGFEGFVITDNAMMGDFQNADQGIAAGNDMMLSSTQKEITIDETAEGRQMMRKACHNILYVVANSNALEHARPGVPGWIYAYVAFDAVMLGLIALGFMGCTKKKKVKVNKEK